MVGIPILSEVLENIDAVAHLAPRLAMSVPAIGAPVAGAALASTVVASVTDDRGRFDDEVADAAAQADSDRAQAWGERDALTRLTSSMQYSDHAIVDDDPFDAMSHAEIYAHVNEMDPNVLDAIGRSWQAIAGRVDAAVSTFRDAVGTSIGEGWQGRGGSAALDAVLAYADDGGALRTRVDLVSNKVREAQIALAEAKRSIPEPDGASVVERVLSVVPGATWKQADHEAEEAERRARQLMKDVYLPSMKRADDQVPILPAAFNPITGGSGAGSSTGGNGVNDGGAVSGTALGAESYSATEPYPGHAGPESGDPRGDGAGGVPGHGGPRSAADPSGTASEANHPTTSRVDPAATTAASALPAAPAAAATASGNHSSPGGQALAGTAGGVGSPGVGGGGGSIGPGGPGGRAGGSSGPGGGGRGTGSALGVAAPGGTGRGAVSGVSGPGSAGAQGNRSMMGGVGGMAPGRGQGQGDDDVHDTPGYLVTVENGHALIGDLPMVSPAVLGE